MSGPERTRLVACHSCGNRVARDARRCPACGTRDPARADTDARPTSAPSAPVARDARTPADERAAKTPGVERDAMARPARGDTEWPAPRPPRSAARRRHRAVVALLVVLFAVTGLGVAAVYVTRPRVVPPSLRQPEPPPTAADAPREPAPPAKSETVATPETASTPETAPTPESRREPAPIVEAPRVPAPPPPSAELPARSSASAAMPSRSRGRSDWLFFFKPGDGLIRMTDDAPLGVVVRLEKAHTFADGSRGPAYVVQSTEGEERVVDADELERSARLR